MIFSKPCQYAILAMTDLASREQDRLIPVKELSEGADVPLPFLAKIIGRLSRHGLIRARRGPGGGVMLARHPSEITMHDIVIAVEGTLETEGCVLGLPECSDTAPCPIHEQWKRIRAELNETLQVSSLADLEKARQAKLEQAARRAVEG
jgi:Rrf2 family protein